MKSIAALIHATLLVASSALGAEVVWFSQSNTDPGIAPAGGASTFTFNSLGSQTLYIWATDGTPVTPSLIPPAGFSNSFPASSAYFSYNLGVSGAMTAAISLTAASIANPNILDSSGIPFTADTDWNPGTPNVPVTRWNVASNYSGAISNITSSLISNINGSVYPVHNPANLATGVMTNIQTGLSTTPNTSYALDQPGYNSARHAFLLGEVSFTTNSMNSSGSTLINLLKNESGLGTSDVWNNPTSPPPFVSLNNDLNGSFTLGSATINVVPEPATWLLFIVGTIALVRYIKLRQTSFVAID